MKDRYLALSIPQDLQDPERQPFLFREWFLGSHARKWIEYFKRPVEALEQLGVKPGHRVLDVGCDWGYTAMLLGSLGAKAYGIELDLISLRFGTRLIEANPGVGANLCCANAVSLPFRSEQFDHVTCIEAIEHFPREIRHSSISEMARCLKPGGRLVISTPNPRGIAEIGKRVLGCLQLLRRLSRHTIWKPSNVPWTPKGYMSSQVQVNDVVPKDEIERHCAGVGLRPVRAKYHLFLLKNTPNWAFMALRRASQLAERLPLSNRFGATALYVYEKPVS
ncbi:MAG: class I SAM-dependent methyltransferase [Candidatus Eisenbacteria sp.]|nr:class I SAM-dependent methyltransferase [Candidatus Eisenbacteria bacterium]